MAVLAILRPKKLGCSLKVCNISISDLRPRLPENRVDLGRIGSQTTNGLSGSLINITLHARHGGRTGSFEAPGNISMSTPATKLCLGLSSPFLGLPVPDNPKIVE